MEGPEGKKTYEATPDFAFELKELKEEEEKAQKEAQAKEEVVQAEEDELKDAEPQHEEDDTNTVLFPPRYIFTYFFFIYLLVFSFLVIK